MCIAGYLISGLGMLFLIFGAEFLKDSISDENKAKRTGTILRIIALPVLIVGLFLYTTATNDLSDNGRIIILIGAAITAIPALLTLITGKDIFAALDKHGRGISDDIKNPTPGIVRKLGLYSLLFSALVFLRAWLYYWF
jgi:hypothetical protein